VEIDALMRYREQLMHSLEIPVPASADAGTLLADFDKEYMRRYGEGRHGALPGRRGVRAAGPDVRPGRDPHRPAGAGGARPNPEHADVLLARARPDQDRRVPRRACPDRSPAPALVELAHTTVAVPHGASLSAGPHGELRLKGF